MSIQPLAGVLPINTNAEIPVGHSRASDSGLFASVLQQMLSEVNQSQIYSDEMAKEMLLGRVDLHQAMIAMEKASLTMQLTVQVRNKLMDAYQEIMRMQV